MRLLFDLESDGLLEATDTISAATKLHCIASVDVDTGKERFFDNTQLEEGLAHLAEADLLIGMNVIRYDFPLLEKLKGFVVPESKQMDLLVLSRLAFTNLKEIDGRDNHKARSQNRPTMPHEYFGSHSVGAWGWRLGVPKLHEDITDWSTYTTEMGERCVGDVRTSLMLWKYLKVDKMSPQAIQLEHETHRLCESMTQAGWPFDERAAADLHAKLLDRRQEIEKKLQETFGGWWVRQGEFVPKRPNKTLGYSGETIDGKFVGYPCSKIEWVDFNPKSHQHIEKVLRSLGWEPTEFTENGAAKTDEEILEGLSAVYPEAAGLCEYLMITKRLGQLATGAQAWMSVIKPDGRIHANYNPLGTITSRAAHFNPNIGQVPSNSKPYGKECRALFKVPEGWEGVGADMEGLELRGLAHYMAKYDNGAFGRDVLDGDVHWHNTIGFGFVDNGVERDKHNALHTIYREKGAKTGIYAIVYGCGNGQLGTIILGALRTATAQTEGTELHPKALEVYSRFFGTDASPNANRIAGVGKVARERFLDNLPALAALRDTVGSLSRKNGWVPGLDKRLVPSRSEHSALNALVQSAGSILCKQWITQSNAALRAAGMRWGWDGDYVFLGWIHDEVQVACRKGLGDQIGKIIVEEARRSGEPFGFRVRLDSKYVIGNNWAETH